MIFPLQEWSTPWIRVSPTTQFILPRTNKNQIFSAVWLEASFFICSSRFATNRLSEIRFSFLNHQKDRYWAPLLELHIPGFCSSLTVFCFADWVEFCVESLVCTRVHWSRDVCEVVSHALWTTVWFVNCFLIYSNPNTEWLLFQRRWTVDISRHGICTAIRCTFPRESWTLCSG